MMMKRIVKSRNTRFFEKYKPYVIPIAAFAGLALIVIILIVQAASTGFTLSRLIDQSSKSKESMDAIVQTLLIETKYTNELRSQFGLSEISYPIQNLLDTKNKSDEDASKNLSFFRAIDKLYNSDIEEKNRSVFRSMLGNGDFQAFIKENKLIMKTKEPLKVGLMKGNLEYFEVTYRGDTEGIAILSFLGQRLEKVTFDSKTIEMLRSSVKSIDAHMVLLDSTLVKFLKIKEDPDLLSALKEKELAIVFVEDTSDRYVFAAAKKDSVLVRFGLDKKAIEFFIDNGQKFKLYDELKNTLVGTVKTMDTREESEKRTEKIQQEINSVMSDKTFKSLLESKKLTIASVPRSDYYFIYYDVTDASGKKIGSIAIDKFRLETYLMDKDDVQISSLKALVEPGNDDVKKN